MAKVLHSLVITLLVAVVYSFPLEHKPNHAPNAPHVLKSQPPPHLHDNKPHDIHHKINRPKRDVPQQPIQPQTRSDQQDQTAYQGPTPKPVHHYRDEPIIQRRSADSSSDESKSSEESTKSNEHKYQSPVFQRDNADKSSSVESVSTEGNSRSEEKRNSEIKTHQRRDTRDQNKEENQSTFQKSNPSVLASNPNIQTPALKSTSEDQNAPHILASNPSSQYGISSSTRVPDLIPASSTNLRTTYLTGTQQQGNVRDDQNRQPLGASDETSTARVAGDDPQQRKTRDADEKVSHPLLSSSQNDEATKLKSSTTNQGQRDSFENQPHVLSANPSQQPSSQNRGVRDVNENQPHLLASNPQTSLYNRDEPSRSASTVLSSSTTENTRISNTHVQKF